MKDVRKEIKFFAQEMERVMAKHDEREGDSWKRVPIIFLENKLKQKFNVWDIILNAHNDTLVDIANYCMMIYFRDYKKVE